jgi:CRP-like cAMP-binding protein
MSNGLSVLPPLKIPGCERLVDLPAPTLIRRRQTLFLHGMPPREADLIHSGLVKLIRRKENREQMIVAIRGSGWILGADAVILGYPHSFEAVALTECAISVIPSGQFLEKLKSPGPFADHVTTTICHGINGYLSQVVELRALSAAERLDHLMETIQPLDRGNTPSPMTKREMAQFLGITPEHLSRMIAKRSRAESLLSDVFSPRSSHAVAVGTSQSLSPVDRRPIP